jgi:hypothetical protein
MAASYPGRRPKMTIDDLRRGQTSGTSGTIFAQYFLTPIGSITQWKTGFLRAGGKRTSWKPRRAPLFLFITFY